jgi:hypothetical protein
MYLAATIVGDNEVVVNIGECRLVAWVALPVLDICEVRLAVPAQVKENTNLDQHEEQNICYGLCNLVLHEGVTHQEFSGP